MTTRYSTLNRILTTTGFALALVLGAALSTPAPAQEKGAEKLIQLKPVKTLQDAQGLEPGDMVTMSCPKCKNTAVTYVTTERGQIKTTASGVIHLCPGCETKVVSKGHGRNKEDVLVHVCKACGSKDAFCCVMKKGQGSTPGMEHK
jgi:hypothetical protein